jgi:phenylacetate-CoA ligase
MGESLLDNRLLKRAYCRAPGPVRDVMASVYGFTAARKRFGKYFQQYFDEFSQTQWYSQEQIEEIQNRRLRRLLEHAAEHVPYYRQLFGELGLSPRDVADKTELHKLPILEKETFRRNSHLFRSSAYGERDVVYKRTGGTTGKALTVAISLERFQAEQAIKWFHYSWSGIRRGDRIATLAGHPVAPAEQRRPPFWVTNHAENQVLFSPNHLNEECLAQYARKLAQMHPALIHGYPWTIYLLALCMGKAGRDDVHPKAIYTSSETILEHQRRAIEQQFGCKVYDFYGSGEMVANILECPDGSRHVIGSHSIVEFLRQDGTPALPGEEAEMVCTSLLNLATPLIRYRSGDIVVLSDRQCSCSRPGPLVEKIIGRVEDVIVAPDGKYWITLDLVFKEVDTIVEAQIVQPSREQLLIKVVRGPGYCDADTQKMLDELRRLVGDGMRIDFEFMEKIPRTPLGKFRPMLSCVPLELEESLPAGPAWPGARRF